MTITTGFPCPECGAWTEVKATRREIRTRLCGNGHKFQTKETVFQKQQKKHCLEGEENDVPMHNMREPFLKG
jgi:hypothetical protein